MARVRGSHLAERDLAAIDAYCHGEGIACLYFLAALDDLATLHAAAAGGFDLVDVRVTLIGEAGPLAATPRPPHPRGVSLRPSAAADVSALQRIAAASHDETRFTVDAHFPRHRKPPELAVPWQWLTRLISGRV